jgi:hypothetical protein
VFSPSFSEEGRDKVHGHVFKALEEVKRVESSGFSDV